MHSISPPFSPRVPPRRVFVALFLIAAGTLIFEIALTRLFSLFFQYHFVFLAVSIAVFGLSIGAALARLIRPEPDRLSQRLVQLLIGISIAYPMATLFIALLPSTASIWPRALLALIPFVGTGFFTATVFEYYSESSGSLYSADLIGSAAGLVLVVVLLNTFSAFTLVYLIGLVLAGTAFYLGNSLPAASLLPRATAIGITLLIFGLNLMTGWLDYNPLRLDIDTAPRDKTMLFILNDPAQEAKIIRTAQSPFARVDVVESNNPDAMFVFTDGGAGSFMLRFDGGTPDLSTLFSIEALPFLVRQPESVLIVGAGGGKDILMALAGGVESITAVEVNPAIVNITRELGDFNGDIYDRPEVRVVQGDGRNFAERSQDSYDLIYLNLVYSQAAEPASQALVENYIFTEEAFEAYYDRLAPGGHLAVVSHNALEGSRAAVTALKALQNLGIEPGRGLDHIALWMYPSEDPTLRTSVMLLGKDPLTLETLQTLTSGARTFGMTALFSPGDYELLFRSLRRLSDVDDFIDPGASYDLSPTTDDSPFFFKLDFGTPPAIRQAFIGAMFVAALLFAAAFVFPRKPGSSSIRWLVMVMYAALIGAGYLLIEIPLIQRFQLLLGYPILTLAVTLGVLLFASGLGSLISQRWEKGKLVKRVAAAAFFIAVLGLAYRFFLPPLVEALLPAGMPARVAAVVILSVLAGLPMGFPFPSLIRLSGDSQQQVALLWAVNGAFSALGSVTAVILSMAYGYSWALAAGAVCYLLLSGLVWLMASQNAAAA